MPRTLNKERPPHDRPGRKADDLFEQSRRPGEKEWTHTSTRLGLENIRWVRL